MLSKSELQTITIRENADIASTMESLKKSGHGIAIAVDAADRVVGVATDGDIRRILLKTEDIHAPITQCLVRDFVYITEREDRENILKLLDSSIRAIPVLDNQRRLVDVVVDGHIPHSQPSQVARARAPARISLAGGGTDFTSYFMDHGGAGLSCTIAKYSHAVLKKREDSSIRIYSHDYQQQVKVNEINELEYNGTLDLIKAGIKILRPDFGFDLEIGCDFPPSSGLGGSASLLASVITCFNEFREHKLDRYAIAEHAFEAERIELKIAGGWQDQYSTVFGGFNYLQFGSQHNVVTPLRLEEDILREIEERAVLCHTGRQHLGSSIQKHKHVGGDNKMKTEVGERLKNITDSMKHAFLKGEYNKIGTLLDETWDIKKEADPNVTNSDIDSIYDAACSAGAQGGRLLGTGGGGYFLFFVPPFRRYSLMEKLAQQGLNPEAVIFDEYGVRSWRANL